MQRYDIKLYDVLGEERETIRDLTHVQMCDLRCVFGWANIKHTVKAIDVGNGAQEYLEANCKWPVSVDKAVAMLTGSSPRRMRGVLGWNGSMACKFLRLAGAWDELSQHEKNVILGYEVAK